MKCGRIWALSSAFAKVKAGADAVELLGDSRDLATWLLALKIGSGKLLCEYKSESCFGNSFRLT
jgi:hypothetical protein